jgi:microcystin-dependent protein
MATFTNAWDETIPLNDLLAGLSEAGKIDDLIRQMKLDIRERILKFMPVGMVIKWPGSIVPYGFKECDGSSLSRTAYPDLLSVLGTVYGTADATHFNIPKMQGYFARGWNHARAAGLFDPDAATRTVPTIAGATMVAGDHVGTIQADENKAHTHSYYSYDAAGIYKGLQDIYYYKYIAGEDTGDTGDENRPSNIYFKFIIRVDDENSDGSYDYTRTWDETTPIDTDYFGRQALELRKLKVDVEELLNNFFPPGIVAYWPNPTAPTGYVELNGQELEIATYPDLYDQIEDMFGVATSGYFKVPDVRGLFIRAQENATPTVDSLASSRTGGNTVGSTQEDGIKAHTHSTAEDMTVYSGYPTEKNYGGFATGAAVMSYPSSVTTSTPSRTVDTHPKNMYLMAIMKVLPA